MGVSKEREEGYYGFYSEKEIPGTFPVGRSNGGQSAGRRFDEGGKGMSVAGRVLFRFQPAEERVVQAVAGNDRGPGERGAEP